jgi:hypothetical protein
MPPPGPEETPKTEAAQPASDASAAPAAPVEETPAEKPRLPVRPPAKPQPVAIGSSPAGATATLDGHRDAACSTPCSLHAAPGRHSVAVVLPGYQVEHVEVQVGSAPVELPPVVLRMSTGTLMLSTVPAGAAVDVDGRRWPQTTPVQIPLPAGSHHITVEKDGKRAASPVEIRGSAISTLRITLE